MKRILLFLFFIFTALSTQAGLFDKKPAFLPVDDAFQFSAAKSENQENVIVNWSIAEGYYLYQEKISVKLNQEENHHLMCRHFLFHLKIITILILA